MNSYYDPSVPFMKENKNRGSSLYYERVTVRNPLNLLLNHPKVEEDEKRVLFDLNEAVKDAQKMREIELMASPRVWNEPSNHVDYTSNGITHKVHRSTRDEMEATDERNNYLKELKKKYNITIDKP